MRQHLRDEVVADAAVDDVRCVVDALHHTLPRLVHVLEPPRLHRQLLHHITAREHRFQVDPQVLDDQPVVGNLQRVGQVLYPFFDFVLKRTAVPVTAKSLSLTQRQQLIFRGIIRTI